MTRKKPVAATSNNEKDTSLIQINNQKSENKKFIISIVVAAISLFAVIVTLANVLNTNMQAKDTLTLMSKQNNATITVMNEANEAYKVAMVEANEAYKKEILAEISSETDQYKYQVGCFVVDNYDSIFGEDAEKRKNVMDVMMVTFDEDLCSELFVKLRKYADTQEKKAAWDNGLIKLEEINAFEIGKNVKVCINYETSADTSVMDELNDLLSEKGYKIWCSPSVEKDTFGFEIRYFHEEDSVDAIMLAAVVDDFFSSKNITCDVEARYQSGYENQSQGSLEIWLSSLA